MSEFKEYKRKSIIEMCKWEEGMVIDHVSISEEDQKNGSPKQGDMIARNPKNHNDQWLVAKQYFEDNLELITNDISSETPNEPIPSLIEYFKGIEGAEYVVKHLTAAQSFVPSELIELEESADTTATEDIDVQYDHVQKTD